MRLFFSIMMACCIMTPALADDPANIPNYARESSGLISSDLEGAFPKALWKDQPRSEVQYLLETMPTHGTNRALQKIKKDFLISQGDTRLIDNDIQKTHYKDIFALRLKKLMELGAYTEAFKLYTNNVETPETSELAEIGLLLTLDKKGFSTTCLDVKVLSPTFDKTPFWQNMNAICDRELGTPESAFEESVILQDIYNDENFVLPAQYTDRFLTFSPLERHTLFKKERVNYDKLKAEHIDQLPPQITRFFLNDPNFPQHLKSVLQAHAIKQNLLPLETAPSDQDDTIKIKEISQEALEQALKKRLLTGALIPEDWMKRLHTLAVDSPKNYVYIELFSLLSLTEKEYTLPEDKWSAGIEDFPEEIAKNLKYLKTTLDKETKFSNNPTSVYEKRLVVSENNNYKLPEETESDLWSGWQKEAEIQNYIGLSFLIALNNDPNDHDLDQTLRVLSSLSTVGLIEKTHQLGREYLAYHVVGK